MKHTILLILICTFITSCEINEKPKVVYQENDIATNTELKKDSTLIEIADIPVHIDSTNYLIHPIGEYHLYGGGRSSYSIKASYSAGSFIISNFNRNEISGNLFNIKFEEIESEETRMLTDKNIIIKSVSFLRNIFDKTKNQILVYKVIDKDTNGDKELNEFDISSLYISQIDGTMFTKLTNEFHELIDWEALPIKNRLYFRSIEDSNKNGEFEKEDKILYQYINLSDENWKVIKYNPI